MTEQQKKNEIEELKRQLALLDGSNPQQLRMKQALQKKYELLKEERTAIKKSRNAKLHNMKPQQRKQLAEIRATMKTLDIRNNEQRTKRKKLKELYRKIRDNPNTNLELPTDLLISSPTTARLPEIEEIENTASDNSSDVRSDQRTNDSKELIRPEERSVTTVLQENCRKIQATIIKRHAIIGNHTVYVNEYSQEFKYIHAKLENTLNKLEKEFESTEQAITAMRRKQELEMKELFQQIQKCENDCLGAQTRQKREKEIMTSAIKEHLPQNLHVTVAGALISLLKYCLYMTAKMRDLFVGN